MARQYLEGADRVASVNESYLKVLVAHSQKELKASKTASQEAMIGAVTAAHERLYNVILAAVITPDIEHEDDLESTERAARARERNRRSNFARSAKSVLVNWLRAGHKLSALDPASANKEQMQREYKPAQQSTADQIQSAQAKLFKLLRQLAAEDPGAARERLAEVEAQLAQALPPMKAVVRGSRKVGEITLNPH